MKFLNKKEQVLDIQLTQYGKRLLAEGSFKPQYYAFYDDDVLYDSQYGVGPEDQYRSEERIFDTPRLETQYIFSGVETKIKEQLEQYVSQQQHISFKKPLLKFQNESDRDFLISPLGTSDLTNEYFPSWEIRALKEEIDNPVSSSYKSGSLDLKIPQIKYEITYDIEREEIHFEDLDDSILEEFDNEVDVNISGMGTFAINRKYGFLEIKENNTDFLNENFEVEVFLVNSDDELQRLYFQKEPKQVQDGILLDPDDPRLKTEYINDPNYVEYFFDFQVDKEIPEHIFCDAKENDKLEKTYFDDYLFNCKDGQAQSSQDIYAITEGAFEDPCEE